MKNRKKSTRQLVGIEDITAGGVQTADGELTFYLVQPTNLNVLPDQGVRSRVMALLNVLKAMAEIELLALDSKESFQDNRQFYRQRLEQEGKQEFSAVNIMDGWQSWSIRDMSTATYHATRPQFASNDEKWRKLLEHLGGKELTSAGHLSAQNFSFSDEVMMENGKLNFYVQADFDVDAAFGTFVCTDENDDWLNIYANYDIMRDRPCDTLELNLCKGDGTEENWSYHLNAAEQEVLARKMEAFCQQQNGMSLRDFARQLQEEPGPSQQIQM